MRRASAQRRRRRPAHGVGGVGCKAVGGFAIARMSDGTIDWFPFGQPPHRHGEPDRGAVILGKWRWNHRRWSRIA